MFKVEVLGEYGPRDDYDFGTEQEAINFIATEISAGRAAENIELFQKLDLDIKVSVTVK